MDDAKVTQLLSQWQAGDTDAFDRLVTLLYPEFKAIAVNQFRRERAGHTLQPTALINEAFLQLRDADIEIENDLHLKRVVAFTMRRVLVDHARRRNREKRGGNLSIRTFRDDVADRDDLVGVVDLDNAIQELSAFDPLSAELLCLHYFGGMTYAEMSAIVSKAESTVHSKLRHARAWLASRGSL